MKALPHSHETYLRVNDHGILLVQHMVANNRGDSDNMYLEYLCCAEGDDYLPEAGASQDDDDPHRHQATNPTPFAALASPAF